MKHAERYIPQPMKKREIFLNNFLGGMAWGLGSVIGATIVVGIIGFFLSQSKTLPFVGKIVETTLQEMEKQQYSLQKRGE